MKSVMDIAAEALHEVAVEDMSLAEHDLRYHDNNYRGGPCLYREKMGNGDNSDASLEEANKKESVIYGARRYENKMIENEIYKNFPSFNIKNARIQILEPDKVGNSRLMVWCGMNVADGKLPQDKLTKVMKGLGYDTMGYSILEEKPGTENGQERAKPKKLFVADIRRRGDDTIQYADARKNQADAFTYKHDEGEGELDDAKKSEMLKMFGIKSEGGRFKRRTEEDARRDRIRKYLGITGDFEGQSNREDRQTGRWEADRVAARKRSLAARKDELGY